MLLPCVGRPARARQEPVEPQPAGPETPSPAPLGVLSALPLGSDEADMTMTPRERVLAAVRHEEPDRVPIVLGVSNATGIKMKPYHELKQLLGIAAGDAHLYRWPELGTAAMPSSCLS